MVAVKTLLNDRLKMILFTGCRSVCADAITRCFGFVLEKLEKLHVTQRNDSHCGEGWFTAKPDRRQQPSPLCCTSYSVAR